MAANNSNAPKPADKPVEKPAKKAAAAKVVRVKVKRLGFYGDRLRPVGMVFNITLRPDEKIPSWVDVVDENNDPVEPDTQSAPSDESKGSSSDDVI